MKKVVVGVAVAVVVAGAVYAVLNWPPTPSGQATGSSIRPGSDAALQNAMWEALAAHESTYLKAYSEQFQARPDDPLEVLAAFNELAYNVTGRGGLWRKTVPDKYFGCAANEELPICGQFRKLEPELSKWDGLQEQMMSIESPKEARKFLREHGREMEEYLKTYVPQDESFTAVQATPWFSRNLASSM